MTERLIAPTFLFRFSAPCHFEKKLWTASGVRFGDESKVPHLAELDGRQPFADIRMAWNDDGLAFGVTVRGKKQPLWCRDSRIEDSDGLQVWVDTRDTHNIHRAGRFCHRFVFLPQGSGPRMDQPVATLLPIGRARENPKVVEPGTLRVKSECFPDGYSLTAFVPAAAMTGFDPSEHPRLGFMYMVIDRELGRQSLTLGPEYPIDEDPSLWGTMELVRV